MLCRNRARQDRGCRVVAPAGTQAKGGHQQTFRNDRSLLIVLQLETAAQVIEDRDVCRHARLQGAERSQSWLVAGQNRWWRYWWLAEPRMLGACRSRSSLRCESNTIKENGRPGMLRSCFLLDHLRHLEVVIFQVGAEGFGHHFSSPTQQWELSGSPVFTA